MKTTKNIGTRLALAGMGTALALLFITLGFFIKNLSTSFVVISSVGVMLPLTKNYYRESLLTAVASCIIGFFIANINILSYVFAGSFYVIFTVFWYNKKGNKLIGYVIKFIYSCIIFFVLYQVTNLIAVDFSKVTILAQSPKWAIYLIINAIFSIVFLVYDFLLVKGYVYMSFLMEKYVKSKK